MVKFTGNILMHRMLQIFIEIRVDKNNETEMKERAMNFIGKSSNRGKKGIRRKKKKILWRIRI